MRLLKVLHFILGKANKNRANGVNQVIAGLAKYTARLGAEVRVVGKAESVAYEGEIIQRDGFEVEAYSYWGKPLRAALEEHIDWADVVHLHGTYSLWNLLVGRMCGKAVKSYIVTLHDGLAPERAKSRGKIRKYIFHTVAQKRHLNNAAAVHVLTEEEATDLFAAAIPRRVFCIPNGIDQEDYPAYNPRDLSFSKSLIIGCLGRLSAEKNLDSLCQAVENLSSDIDIRLILAGPETKYGKKLVSRYSNSNIELVGPKFGKEKEDFINSLDLFIHPSLCEVFSIAGMEVLASGTPLLITRTSKASYFYNRNAFFMCEPTVFGLESAIKRALDKKDDWPQMIVNGRRLVEDTFNWKIAAGNMHAAYNQIVERKYEARSGRLD